MGDEMSKNGKTESQWRIEDQEWWKKYSAMVRSQESEPIRYIGSGFGSGGSAIHYIGSGSGSGSLSIRYAGSGSGSGSLGIRYIGSGSGSLGIRYIGSGSGSLGIRYIGSGSGSLSIRYVGSGSGKLQVRHLSSVPLKKASDKKVPEETYQDPYVVYDRSRFPGESSASGKEDGIYGGYGLDLI